MEITVDNKKIIILFDRYGNIYLENNNNLYELEIDKKNNPIITNINNNKQEEILNINKITINKNKLQQKIIDEDNEEYKEIEDKEYTINGKIKEIIIDEDNINEYGIYNKPFIFYSPKYSETKIIDMDQNISALYDTYIYENNTLIFVSKSCEEESIYRLILHTNGIIQFRNIGENNRQYRLNINNDTINISQNT